MQCPLSYRRPYLFFFFNDTATTEIYTLSLHDALPICVAHAQHDGVLLADLAEGAGILGEGAGGGDGDADRKSTRLNSSHQIISYAVFCLKKKNNTHHPDQSRHVLATTDQPHPLIQPPG